MSVDGCVRGEERDGQPGYLAGSKSLDALDKIMTSTESYFHPSNSGHWTISVRLHTVRAGAWALTRSRAVDELHATNHRQVCEPVEGGGAKFLQDACGS